VYIVTSLGFVRQSFDALVDGIEKCIIQAHENLQPGSIFVNKGEGTCMVFVDYEFANG
jgi:neutral ceramidase